MTRICKELSLKNNRAAFQGNRKADQWSDRNHWHKPEQFPRFKVGIDKLIAQPSQKICHCQSLRLLRLCALLGNMGPDPVESWKKQIQWYSENDCFSELNRIDGQLMEFVWQVFPGFTTVGILNKIQQMMGKLQCEPENFTGRIIFVSMFNDIAWDAKGNDELCVSNSKTIREYAERFPRGHLSFLALGSKKKRYGTYRGKPDGSWNRTAEKINAAEFQRFPSSNIPMYQPLGERTIKKQRRRTDNNSLQRKYGKH